MVPSSIHRNFKDSPLLRLPLEIRQRIWKHAIGNRFLHVQQWNAYPEDEDYEDPVDGRWHKLIWRTNYCVEAESYRGPDDETSPRSVPHTACVGDDYSFMEELWERELREESNATENDSDTIQQMLHERKVKRRPHLHLLRVCRQIYIEACPIIWTTNTFSFHEALTLKAFFDNRKVAQKKLLRNLHLRLEWCDRKDKYYWDKKLTLPLIKTITGLKSLHVDLAQSLMHRSSFTSFRQIAPPGNRLFHSLQWMYVEQIANFSVLPLEDVTVSIMHHCDWKGRP